MCLKCKSNSLKSSPGCIQYLNELIYLKDLAFEKNDRSIIDTLSKWISEVKKKCPDEKELKKIVEKLTK
jgi:hypothetical protein